MTQPAAPAPAAPAPAGQDALAGVVQEYLAHLTVERGLSPNTLAAYRRDLERYVGHLAAQGRGTPAQITPEDVEDFVTALRGSSDRWNDGDIGVGPLVLPAVRPEDLDVCS